MGLALPLMVTTGIAYNFDGAPTLLSLPLAMLGGMGLLWLWEQVLLVRLPILSTNRLYGLALIAALIVLWGVSALVFVRTDTLSTSPFTRDQLTAFDWIRRESDQQVDFVFGNDTPDHEHQCAHALYALF
jgi:hypothetical protein